MTTGPFSKSLGVFNIYSTRSLDCAMFWLQKFTYIPCLAPMKKWKINFSKNRKFSKYSSEPNMVCMLFFWSQNIVQSRYLEEYVFKTPTLFENGPVVIEIWSLATGGKSIFSKFGIFRRKSSNLQNFRNFGFSDFFVFKKIDDYWSVFKNCWCFKYVLFEITRLRYVLAPKN